MSSNRLPRILLVDDEPTVLAMMARALTESGYDVREHVLDLVAHRKKDDDDHD